MFTVNTTQTSTHYDSLHYTTHSEYKPTIRYTKYTVHIEDKDIEEETKYTVHIEDKYLQ